MTQTQRPRLYEIRETERETIALVQGEAIRELPTDLYIPPEALEVFLEAFEGPLDLLLYLIRRENLDILDIKVAEITEQYMAYVELMKAMQLELAAEYLVMAAMLAEIKSRMLLPRPVSDDEDEDDPRAELIRRLQEYEQIKSAAESLDELPRLERDIHLVRPERPEPVRQHADPEVDLKELLVALAHVLRRAEMFQHHSVTLEPLSVRERMSDVLQRVNTAKDFVPFTSLFTLEEGRMGVVVTFLALLELIRESLLELVQNEPFAPIYVRARAGDADSLWDGPAEETASDDVADADVTNEHVAADDVWADDITDGDIANDDIADAHADVGAISRSRSDSSDSVPDEDQDFEE